MSTLLDFLTALRARGVRFRLEGDTVRYRAPKNALGPEEIATLGVRKAEIVAFLREAQARGQETITVRPLAAGPARLSLAQQRLWFLDQLDGESSTYNIPAAMHLRGALDVAALDAALAAIIRRHDTLRTAVAIRDGIAVQDVAETTSFHLHQIDLSKLAERERREEAAARAALEADQPFNLMAASALLRATLIRLGENEHVLVVVLHHLIADGWSMGVFCAELSKGYAAVREGRSPVLASLPIQYGDYAEWQHCLLESGRLADAIAYWRDSLKDAPPLLQILPHRPRLPVQSFRGATLDFWIGAKDVESARRFAQAAGTSLYTVLLAAFLALVRRTAGRDDLVIGVPVANRDRKEIEPLIGFFTNTLALRFDTSGDPNFRALVERVRRTALDGYAHQEAPFDRVVEATRPERDSSFTPVVQTMFMFYDREMGRLALPGIVCEPFAMEVKTAKCDFTFALQEQHDALRAQAIYNSELFDRPSVERLIAQFKTFLASALAEPDLTISRFSLERAEDLAALIRQGRGPVLEVDSQLTLDEAIRDTMRRHCGRVAVVDATRSLTYAELDAEVERVAAGLRFMGVRRGELVAVFLDRSVELIVAILGVLRAGAAYLPLDPDHASARHEEILRDAGAPRLITAQGLLPPRGAGPVLLVDAPELRPIPVGAASTKASDLAYVIYTSGSTGKPRGVMIEQHSVINLVAALRVEIYRKLPEGLAVGLIASCAFDASVQQIFASLILGHSLHLVDGETRRDSEALIAWLAKHRIEVADITPSLLALLLAAGLGRRPDIQLCHLLVGGEALPAALAENFLAGELGGRCRLTNVYGPTECSVDVTALTLEGTAPPSGAVVSIGRPLANVRVYILDESGQLAPSGIAGEICLAGPSLGRGYLGMTEFTARKFAGHPALGEDRLYRTGDRGAWMTDGTIAFLGRADNQVKIRGHRIETGEIDAILARHHAIERAVTVVHRPEGGWLELAAYIVGRGQVLEAGALRRWLAERLPDYMIPAHFLMISALPLTPNGKVDRAALPAVTSFTPPQSARAFCPPGTEEEKVLARVWQGVLGGRAIGLDDDFFDLGGDSIKALQIAARLRAAGWHLGLRDFLSRPRIAELAPLLRPLGPKALAAEPENIPLTPIQRWFFENFDGVFGHYNQSLLLTPVRPLAADALATALDALLVRHPMLNAVFTRFDGSWRQSLRPQAPFALERIDARGEVQPLARLSAEAARLQANCDLGVGPLFRGAHILLPKGERLLLIAHHLVVDGVSWRILLDDLEAAYLQAEAGWTPDLAETDSFAAWAARLCAHAESPEIAAEKVYWAEVSKVPLVPLPLSEGMTPGRFAERRAAWLALSQDLTVALDGPAHRAYRTGIEDLLLTGLIRAVGALWQREEIGSELMILLEGHGREMLFPDLDVSRTVGWFTSQFPLRLKLSGGDDLGRQIKEIKEALRRVPNRGVGYGILRHLRGVDRDTNLSFDIEPNIRFNYLGSFESTFANGLFRWADEESGPASDPGATMGPEIDIVAIKRDGVMEIELGYCPRRMEPATMERLAELYKGELERILDHVLTAEDGGPTPSDLDYTGFEIDTLEQFISHLS